MGCDIHGWVEVALPKHIIHVLNRVLNHFELEKVALPRYLKDNDKYRLWVPVLQIDYVVGRNYCMFGNLFGVRNYKLFEPIAAGRGIPDDVSDLVRNDYEGWGPDAHSESFITYKEVKSIDWNEKGKVGVKRKKCLTEDWKMVFKVMKFLAREYGDDNVRLVVWFDN